MQRPLSNWWWILLWIPVLALVFGLLSGCAVTSAGAAPVPVQPSPADLQRLVAQELAADSRFDSFAASGNADAQDVAALFRPTLAGVNAVDCRAAPAHSVDCTLEVVMRFPAMDGRESRTYWERRLRQVAGSWQVVSAAQP